MDIDIDIDIDLHTPSSNPPSSAADSAADTPSTLPSPLPTTTDPLTNTTTINNTTGTTSTHDPTTSTHDPDSSQTLPEPEPYTAKAATHIHRLTALDAAIPTILTSASRAVRVLTTPSSALTGTSDPAVTSALDKRKKEFEKHTTRFYEELQALDAHLRREIYALEEAGLISSKPDPIIPTNKPSDPHSHPQPGQPQRPMQGMPQRGGMMPGQGQRGGTMGGIGKQSQEDEEKVMQVTNNGLGNLDVGWLNGRAGGGLARGVEGELWGSMRRLLEAVVLEGGRKERGSDGGGEGDGGMDVEDGGMDVDEDVDVEGG